MASLELAKEGSIVNALFDYAKAGYWFTFALFEYFCFYILFQQFVRLFRLKGIYEDLFLLTLGGAIYVVTIYGNVVEYGWDQGLPALIGIPSWHNFLFFVIGTRIRKYFSSFEQWLDTRYAVAFVVSIYILVNILPYVKDLSSTLFNLVTATTGILLVFALFRHHQDFFATHRIGKTMQFVGRRTLDIYLIHYFFLWSNMQAVLPNFGELNSPFLEFICSSTIALLIMACCLGVSCVLRLSPVMAHFLFGEKTTNTK
jgi:peptidoglycan/LPS O-acetylase OafA/YrhL